MWHSTVECIVTLVLSLLVVAPLAAAQPAGKVHRIGWLTIGVRPAEPHPLLEALGQGLRDLGYVEGQNMRIEARYAEGQEERGPALVAELVHLPVDVLVAAGTAPIQAAQHATSTMPIVMAWGTDPVAQGFVAGLARPGGNITGLSAMRHDLQTAFAALPQEGVQALLVNASRTDFVALALQSRLPAMYNGRRDVEAGGLMSYGPNQPAMHYRAAYYVDRLLKGATAADLPVEQAMRFELVINLKTAQALGLTLPPTILFQADEVIR